MTNDRTPTFLRFKYAVKKHRVSVIIDVSRHFSRRRQSTLHKTLAEVEMCETGGKNFSKNIKTLKAKTIGNCKQKRKITDTLQAKYVFFFTMFATF